MTKLQHLKTRGKVRFITLGKTDIEVSVICLGAFAIGGFARGGNDERDSLEAINTAIDSGINFIDTAPIYGKGLSEEIIGKAIKGRRDKVVIASKVGLVWHVQKGDYFFDYPNGGKIYKYLAPESIQYEIEQSLSRLGTDYIDLYQTHWQDSTTPIEDTLSTLMDLKKQGKIRAIGASNATIKQLKEYNNAGELDADQEQYNLIDTEQEKKQLPWCKENKVTMLAYRPLAAGLLTGKLGPEREFKGDDRRKGDPRFSVKNRTKINSVIEKYFNPIAQKYNLTVAQLSVAALVSQDGVVSLSGARNQNQVEENIKAGGVLVEKEDVEKLKSAIKSLNL